MDIKTSKYLTLIKKSMLSTVYFLFYFIKKHTVILIVLSADYPQKYVKFVYIYIFFINAMQENFFYIISLFKQINKFLLDFCYIFLLKCF